MSSIREKGVEGRGGGGAGGIFVTGVYCSIEDREWGLRVCSQLGCFLRETRRGSNREVSFLGVE